MLALFLQGKSYRAIGEVYGMSGEGARKIVAPIKTPNAVGGYSLGAKIRAASVVQGRAAKRDARTMKNYGCSYEEALQLNDGRLISDTSGYAKKYQQQKLHAGQRNIEFKLTLKQWVELWKESGALDKRGRGQGFCMARHGDIGAYEACNIYFCTIGKNFSDSYQRYSAAERRKTTAIKKAAAASQSLVGAI